MRRSTFIKACELAAERGDIISIGGGEPTIHPLFWDFIGLALAHGDIYEVPWLATNGKVTETALRLANLAKRGVLAVDLSRDEYHEEIDYEVVEAFTVDKYNRGDRVSDYRSIRDVTGGPIAGVWREPIQTGRYLSYLGLDEDDQDDERECVCNDIFVAPDGIIHACGCQEVQYGTVWEPQFPASWDCEWPDEYCSRAECNSKGLNQPAEVTVS